MLTSLFGSTPLRTSRLTTMAGGRMPTSLAASFRFSDGKRGEIALDQRPHRGKVEAADEHEGEVAGVGEAVLVEGQRLVEAHLIDRAPA